MTLKSRQWTVGDVRVTRIEETSGPGFSPAQLFADWTAAQIEPELAWLAPDFYDPGADRLITSVHSWLVRTPAHTILIDTCAGNHKERPSSPRFHRLDTPWLSRLLATGTRAEDIDFVLCTHLHVDHVGWNTRLLDGRWVPTFPNAKYVFSRQEHDHWCAARPGTPGGQPGKRLIYEDSVLPVVEAGKALLVKSVHALDDWITLEPSPGHTPGHILAKLASRGRKAVFSGDILHHPIQVRRDHWNSRFCEDQEGARATRRRVLSYCADEGALLMPAHFAHPHAAHIQRRCSGFDFSFGTPSAA